MLTEEQKKYKRDYFKKNKTELLEKAKTYNKKWRMNNPGYSGKYHKKRKKEDPSFKLIVDIRNLIYINFLNKGFSKKSKTTKILGCTIEEFRFHIEKQFEIWMNWQNHGKNIGEYNTTWQLDHIIPVSSAKTEEEIIKLNHYTNFRPLCSKKNRDKWNK